MTPERPEALRVALEVIGLLDGLGIRYHLGGSYASSVHGTPRQTQDIDLVIEVDETSVAEFVSRLPEGYYRDLGAALEAVRHRSSFNLIHLASGVKLDLFVRGDEPFDRGRVRSQPGNSLGLRAGSYPSRQVGRRHDSSQTPVVSP